MSVIRRTENHEVNTSDEEIIFDDERQNIRTNTRSRRNLASFWILGLCNNFAYVIMLSAAKDILENKHEPTINETISCRETIVDRSCHELSTGSVLLADIIPSLLIKTTAPFFIHKIPFDLRHLLTVILQGSSFFLVATSNSVAEALLGVIFASFGSGLGEISYLSLAAHFPGNVVAAWSSGTGGSGIFGALIYAILTDRSMLSLSPKTTLLSMLIVPIVFSYTFWFILKIPNTVHRVRAFDLSSYLIREGRRSRVSAGSTDDEPLLENASNGQQRHDKTIVKSLLKYIIPLVLVYFGEYFINQGLVELLEFDCSDGFSMDVASQYRWYQVLYQLGVFISRSSTILFTIPTSYFPILAALQILNAIFFYFEAIYYFVPHILVIFLIIIFEGLLGGSAYVNTFNSIHREVPNEYKEFSMGFVSISDSFGIVLAGFLAIPIHNYICSLPLT